MKLENYENIPATKKKLANGQRVVKYFRKFSKKTRAKNI